MVSFGDQPIVIILAIAWVVWGSHVTGLAKSSIRCNPILILEASFDDKRLAVGSLSPWLFSNIIWITFIQV